MNTLTLTGARVSLHFVDDFCQLIFILVLFE